MIGNLPKLKILFARQSLINHLTADADMTKTNKIHQSALNPASNPGSMASCPTCEFERGQVGQPQVRDDGTMICKTCNAKWRELGGVTRRPKAPAAECSNHRAEASNLERKNAAFNASAISMPTRTPATMPSDKAGATSGNTARYALSLAIPTLAAAAITWSVFAFLPGLDNYLPKMFNSNDQNSAIADGQLILADVKVENLGNSRTDIWVISAKISNPSPNFLRVPAILMHAGVKGSSGYIARTYQPALQMLAPGANLKIRTSVQKPATSTRNGSPRQNDRNLKNGIVLEFVGTSLNSG